MTIAELRKIFKQIDYYRDGKRKLQDDNSSIMLKVGNKTGYLTSVSVPPVQNKKGEGEKFVLISEMENGTSKYDKTKVVKMKSMVNWLIGPKSLEYSKAEIILRLNFNGTDAEEPLKDVTFGISPSEFGKTQTHEYEKGAQTFFCDFEAIKELERKRAKKAIKWQDEYWTAQDEISGKRGYEWEKEYNGKMKQRGIDRIKQSFKGKYGDDVGESKESENGQ